MRVARSPPSALPKSLERCPDHSNNASTVWPKPLAAGCEAQSRRLARETLTPSACPAPTAPRIRGLENGVCDNQSRRASVPTWRLVPVVTLANPPDAQRLHFVEPMKSGHSTPLPAASEFFHALPGYLIRRLQQVAVSLLLDEFAKVNSDLTPVQYAALTAIHLNPGIDQASLAGIIAFDRATIGGVVGRLEAKGLVRRTVAPEDRRLRVLVTTREGGQLLRVLAPAMDRAQRRIMSPLLPKERDVFLRMLQRAAMGNNQHSRVPVRVITRNRRK